MGQITCVLNVDETLLTEEMVPAMVKQAAQALYNEIMKRICVRDGHDALIQMGNMMICRRCGEKVLDLATA
jgi:hypothetical protein